MSWDSSIIWLDKSCSTVISLLPMPSFFEPPNLILPNQKDVNHREMPSTKQRCATRSSEWAQSSPAANGPTDDGGRESGWSRVQDCWGKRGRRNPPQLGEGLVEINQTSLEDRIRRKILDEGSRISGILRRKGRGRKLRNKNLQRESQMAY